ncbi:MAG TPA: lysophospholipid acyltransferase family protein [Candidatus Polarisedimenticolia bacterium]|nr:lysophospholipid acyltransferase family protein [Candidatus Polarisedimenticolia bacterium]
MPEKRGMMTVVSPKAKSRRRSGVVVPHSPRWFQRLGAIVLYLSTRVYGMTLRMRWDNRSDFSVDQLRGPGIYCLWHNRLLLCMEVYWREFKRRDLGRGLAALISASKDGAFLAAILERFHVEPVRGSSSRRGPQALLELTSWAERGYDLAITPDGPRGPCYTVQEGVMSLAQLTGLPIIPFGFYARRKIRLKSWDRFQIPLPFSRCELTLGKPVYVPRSATDAEREAIRNHLEQVMKTVSRD